MISEITNFFNKNQVLGIILICVLLFVLYNIIKNNSSEHMDQINSTILPQCTINTDQHFYTDFVEKSGVLNFKCNHKGVDYYLACVDMNNYTAHNPNKIPDCVHSMLILIPATEIETMLENYANQISMIKDKCNSDLKIECKYKNPEQECNDNYDICNFPRFFLHDFNVIDVSLPHSDFTKNFRKYIIKGTAIPSLNGISKQTIINTFLLTDNGINVVCGDTTFKYGQKEEQKHYAEVIISERIDENKTMSEDSKLKIKIRFNTLQQLISKNVNGSIKRTPLIDTCTGEHKTRPVYLGICDSTKTCTNGTNTYPRICVYDDISDPNVLEFTPFIVNKNEAKQ